MLWFTVWTVLVLATVAGGLWLGRDLWRRGKALVAELGRAAAVFEALAEKVDALTAEAPAPPVHQALSDPEVHREHRAELHARRDERRAARAVRHAETFARWRAYTH